MRPCGYGIQAPARRLQSQDTSVLEAAKDYDPIAFRAFLLEWSAR